MKLISKWDDLRPYGIDVLTGESCGLGYRLLCDVTATGKRVLEKALGIKELILFPNWNQGSSHDPHIGSVMLVPELLVPIGVFALLEHGCTEVWRVQDHGLLGIEPHDTPEVVEEYKRGIGAAGIRHFAYRGTAGDRNVHVMSGRIQ